MDVSGDKFRVFISHKHDDHVLAERVKCLIESLNKKTITCFVSGVDITAGSDWRRVVRDALAQSHMLLLLFTVPSKNWDWCLFETGLYTRFDKTDIRAVVCLYNPGQAAPSPLTDLQGVPAKADKIGPFLETLCRKTWTVSDDWRRGALVPDIKAEKVSEVAEAIEKEFCRSGSIAAYYPCHRVVLSLSDGDAIAKGIPESARVLEGPNDTSAYTMALFDLAGGSGRRTWGDLLKAVRGTDGPWRHELDEHFRQALDETLFAPSPGRMNPGRMNSVHNRLYHPIIYSIERDPAVDRSGGARQGSARRPRSVTIVLAPESQAARPAASSLNVAPLRARPTSTANT
jgi:hypothetical protein